jgi:hypothetical protein
MDQPRSGRRASKPRRGRRSLAEFALPGSDTPAAVPGAAPLLQTAQSERLPPPAKQPVKKSDKGSKKRKRTTSTEDRKAAASGLSQTDAPGAATSEDESKLHQIEALTSAAVKAAADCQARMLEQLKVNIRATLDYANGFTGASRRPGAAADAATSGPGSPASPQDAGQTTPAAVTAADAYRAKAFELMNANIDTTLDYAKRLVGVRTPTEFSELSASHARKQMALVVKQATELGSIAQKMAASHVKRMTTGFITTRDEGKE